MSNENNIASLTCRTIVIIESWNYLVVIKCVGSGWGKAGGSSVLLMNDTCDTFKPDLYTPPHFSLLLQCTKEHVELTWFY